MKLKSLILGSIAAVGLSTTGYAADLGVLTSLDVCDALGLSGLTISSETNCLQISGGVSYSFDWGNYKGKYGVTRVSADGFTNPGTAEGADSADGTAPSELDWESQVEAWLKFVGTADSDFGAAKAVIKLKSVRETRVQNEAEISSDDDTGSGLTVNGADGKPINQDKGLWVADEAYVQIGDTTVIMAGKKGSIANLGDDEPYNFLGLFNASEVDTGVLYVKDAPKTSNVAIQVVSNVGNGVSVGLGLENLDDSTVTRAGTLVGVVSYAGDSLSAHFTGLVGGILDGTVDTYAMHAGFTGTFDAFKLRAALAAGYDVATTNSVWNGLVSAQGTFDMFTIALSGEATGGTGLVNDYGFGASVGATVTDGVKINLGGRYYNDGAVGGQAGYQIAAQLVAAVTETITVTGEVGVYGTNAAPIIENATTPTTNQTDFYGSAALGWAPGGGFTSSLKGEAHQNGAYRVTFKAAKSFE